VSIASADGQALTSELWPYMYIYIYTKISNEESIQGCTHLPIMDDVMTSLLTKNYETSTYLFAENLEVKDPS